MHDGSYSYPAGPRVNVRHPPKPPRNPFPSVRR